MKKENLTWRTFADASAVISDKWGAGPATYYAIDHKGVIRYRAIGASEKSIDAAVKKLIQEAQGPAKKAPK
jgi:hypothetical protein